MPAAAAQQLEHYQQPHVSEQQQARLQSFSQLGCECFCNI
jgi:hypothetical protein